MLMVAVAYGQLAGEPSSMSLPAAYDGWSSYQEQQFSQDQREQLEEVAASAGMTGEQLSALSPRLAGEAAEGLLSPGELKRRLKISAANRGKKAWNKGRHHSPSTKERIRQRTREAMQRPDVVARLRIANQHRPQHTAETKVWLPVLACAGACVLLRVRTAC